MRYKYTLDTSKTYGRPGVKGHAFSTIEDFERLSAVLFQAAGRHGRIKNVRSDRLYLILKGGGRFDVGGTVFDVDAGDVVIVPRNTPYDYEGEMKLLLVHSPANIDEADIDLEDKPTTDRPPAPPTDIF